MELYIESTNTRTKIKFKGSVAQLIQKLAINPQTILVAKNNELVTEEEPVGDNDEVKLLSVISGG